MTLPTVESNLTLTQSNVLSYYLLYLPHRDCCRSIDDEVDPRVKEGWCKRSHWQQLAGSSAIADPMEGGGTSPTSSSSSSPSSSSSSSSSSEEKVLQQPPTTTTTTITAAVAIDSPSPSVSLSSPRTHQTSSSVNDHNNNNNNPHRYIPLKKPDLPPLGDIPKIVLEAGLESMFLVSKTASLGAWLQLNCRGFLPNLRQQRQFGLASLQMAQALRATVRAVALGAPGLQVNSFFITLTYYLR